MTSITAFIRKYFGWLFTWIVDIIALITWHNPRTFSADQKNQILTALKTDYYFICTHNRAELGTMLINFSDWMLTKKWGFYNHCLMNLENDGTLKLCEATNKTGTIFASFDDVFAQDDGVALLKPKSMALADWTLMLDKAYTDIGKKYDCLYDFKQDEKLSCIELVRNCLQADPDYATNFANFESLIAKYGEITPQMLYDCPDFEVVLEIKVP